MNLEFSAIAYRRIRDRIRAEDPQSMNRPSPTRWRGSPMCMRYWRPLCARPYVKWEGHRWDLELRVTEAGCLVFLVKDIGQSFQEGNVMLMV